MNVGTLGINTSDEGRVLSVGYYRVLPANVVEVPDVPRDTNGAPDDVRRYKWDAETSAYVLVQAWSDEVDAELAREI